MSDLIRRQAAIEIIQSMYPGIPRVPWMRKDWQKRYEPYIRTENAIRELPSAQPDIKRAAKLLLDFIESCQGGDSYLITPDGEELRTDWGYATEGIQLIRDWAERRSDE